MLCISNNNYIYNTNEIYVSISKFNGKFDKCMIYVYIDFIMTLSVVVYYGNFTHIHSKTLGMSLNEIM